MKTKAIMFFVYFVGIDLFSQCLPWVKSVPLETSDCIAIFPNSTCSLNYDESRLSYVLRWNDGGIQTKVIRRYGLFEACSRQSVDFVDGKFIYRYMISNGAMSSSTIHTLGILGNGYWLINGLPEGWTVVNGNRSMATNIKDGNWFMISSNLWSDDESIHHGIDPGQSMIFEITSNNLPMVSIATLMEDYPMYELSDNDAKWQSDVIDLIEINNSTEDAIIAPSSVGPNADYNNILDTLIDSISNFRETNGQFDELCQALRVDVVALSACIKARDYNKFCQIEQNIYDRVIASDAPKFMLECFQFSIKAIKVAIFVDQKGRLAQQNKS